MNFKVLIIKGMNVVTTPFKEYSKALQYKMENGGTIYLKVGSYGGN